MHSLSHLADHVLLQDLKALVDRERGTTADLLSHLAEAEERRLHLPAAYPSMHAYCVGELHFSESEAFKRIQAARAARRFPAILVAVAAGRLHLSTVLQLAPHLTTESADELIAAATHRTKAEVALVIARHCSRNSEAIQQVPEPVEFLENSEVPASADPGEAAEPPQDTGSAETETETETLRLVSAPEPQRLELRVRLDPEAQALLRHARALLAHAIPSGDPACILKRALTQLVEAEEKRIFAAHCRTRPRRGAPNGRFVPADVRRTVWERDGGRCTFTSEAGTRCPAIARLEFDHVVPVARGGESTAANLRLCCRAHNQYAAERTFGAGFVAGKREAARRRAGEGRERGAATRTPPAEGRVTQDARRDEVIPWLRKLGLRVDEAKRGAAMCEGLLGAPLEQRVKVALAGLARERFRGGHHRAAPS